MLAPLVLRGSLPRLEVDLCANGGDPVLGLHAGGVCVGAAGKFEGLLAVADKEADVGGAAAEVSSLGLGCDLVGSVLKDVLALVGQLQDDVGVVDHVLSDCMGLRELVEVLREAEGGRVFCILAGKEDSIAAADREGLDVDFGNEWCSHAEGWLREALGVDGGAVRDGSHASKGCLELGYTGSGNVHPEAGLEVNDGRFQLRLRDIMNGLGVRNAVEFDVLLLQQSAVGHIAQTGSKNLALVRDVELEDVIRDEGRLQHGSDVQYSRRGGAVRAEDGIEAPAGEGAVLQLLQDSQRRGWCCWRCLLNDVGMGRIRSAVVVGVGEVRAAATAVGVVVALWLEDGGSEGVGLWDANRGGGGDWETHDCKCALECLVLQSNG